MELLSAMRVQSAPLVQMHSDGQHYDASCFLSVGDLVLGLLERANASSAAGASLPVLDRMAALTKLGQAYGSTKLLDVRSRWDGTGMWSAATEDMSLADALRRCLHIGLRGDGGRDGGGGSLAPGDPMLRTCPHRFAVIDASGLITDIVAQSDLAMYLRRNRELLDPSVLDATARSLGLGAQGGRRVAQVPSALPAVDAFYEMERQNVQAVAVVDEATDAIIGNLSESDLVTLDPNAFGALALPVGEYLLHAHGLGDALGREGAAAEALARDGMSASSGELYNPKSSPYAAALRRFGARLTVTCSDGSTVGEILDAMHVRAVHRVWVVDDAERPTGVVALSDVLAAVATRNPGEGQTDSSARESVATNKGQIASGADAGAGSVAPA